MEYDAELIECAEEIAKWAINNGFFEFSNSGWEFELDVGDFEFLRGQQSDSPPYLPFAFESIQRDFERDVEEEVRVILDRRLDEIRSIVEVEG